MIGPEHYRLLTGIASFVAFFSLLYLLHWQLRLWPDDRQQWAATLFIGATLLVVGQLCLSYLHWAPAMGTTPRGIISFGFWAATTLGLALESRRHILRALRRMEDARRRGLAARDSGAGGEPPFSGPSV